MKILHIITNTDLGGAQRVLIDLTNCALSDNNEVAVASMPQGPMWDQLSPEVTQFKIKNMIKKVKPAYELKCLFELKKTIKTYNPDVIHLHCSKAGLLGRLAAGKYKNKVVYTVHGFDQIRIAHKKYLPLEKMFQNKCGAIVAVSKYDYDNLIANKINHNVKLIPNAININNTKIEPPQLFKESIENGYKIILSIARLASPKRPDIFAKTAQIIAQKHPELKVKFIWVGGKTDDSLDTMLNNTDSSYVNYFGEYPDASRLIPFCSVFMLFSNHEGLPMTILEALAASKSIIASDVGGIPELISNSNGYLINMVDNKGFLDTPDKIAEDCAEKLFELLSNPDLLNRQSQNSFELFQQKYQLSSMWNQYKDLYKNL